MNPSLKRLIKELGESINKSLSGSDQIAGVIARIKAEGYDVFLVLEATVGFNKRESEGGNSSEPLNNSAEPEFAVNSQDMRFLKSLRISVDDAA